MTNRLLLRAISGAALLVLGFLAADGAAQDPLLDYLQSRIAAAPHDSSSWRLLGNYRLRAGDAPGAREALQQSLALDPGSAAAHFDLARCLLQLGQEGEAARLFHEVTRLAPESDYAAQAQTHLARLPVAVQPASYEIQRFDGSQFPEQRTETAELAGETSRRLFLQLEFGALYNSNVALTPISRELAASDQASAQGIFNPLLEYRLINNDIWSAGPAFQGYFTLNENDALRPLNLQSYQPGWFVERTVLGEAAVWIPRLQYDFTLDQFDGDTFGSRHALTSSLTGLWNGGDTSVLYWSTDYRDFRDDGVTPDSSSRDGWTHSAGLSHQWPLAWRWLSSVTAGGEVQWADVQGSEFAYLGGSLYLQGRIPLTERLWAELEGGAGLRDYYDSLIEPSRNETIWRGSARLTRQLRENWTVSGVFNYDRFDADNSLFAADRYVAGLVSNYRF